MADPLCPTCHSKISSVGSRRRGADGVDSDGNPVPVWSEDPILTPSRVVNGQSLLPANGADYEGFDQVYARNIQELQDDRRQRETDLGILPLTEFTAVDGSTSVPCAGHIVELRMSTERILDAVGETLQDYFRLDATGTQQPSGPTDTADKLEWTDVSRGLALRTQGLNATILSAGNTKFKINETTDQDVPTIPPNVTFVRAIHMEDLRHPILSQYIEYFVPSAIFGPAVLTATIPPGFPNAGGTATAQYDNTLLGSVYTDYRIDATSRGLRWSISHFVPGTNINSGEEVASVTTSIQSNTPSSGAAHKLVITAEGMIDVKIFPFPPPSEPLLAYDVIRIHSNYAVNNFVNWPSNYLKTPIRITNSLKLRLYLDYDFNGIGKLADGAAPSNPHPFFVTFSFIIRARRDPSFLTNFGTKTFTINIGKELQGGSFTQRTTINTVPVTGIFQFDSNLGLSYVDIPLNDIVLPAVALNHTFILDMSMSATVCGSTGSLGGGSTLDPTTIPDSVGKIPFTVMWSGYRLQL